MLATISLDSTTFLFFMAISGFLTSFMSWSFSLMMPAHIRGLKDWSVAMLCMGLSFIFFMTREVLPPILTHFAANALALGIAVFIAVGITEYRGLGQYRKYLLGSYALIVFIFIFEYLDQGTTVLPRRTLLISIPICFLLGFTSYNFYKSEEKLYSFNFLAVLSSIFLTLTMANRIYTVVFGDPSIAYINTKSTAHFLFFTASGITAIAASTSFILMCINRLNLEVLEQKARAQRVNRYTALGEMAAGVAHEINNPLAIIRNNLYAVGVFKDQGPAKLAEVEVLLKKSDNAIERIAKVIKGLLDFAKEGETIKFQNCKAQEIIEKVQDLCQARASSREVKFEVAVDDNSQLNCNPFQIAQVIVNLVNNALDAIQEQRKHSPEEIYFVRIQAKRMGLKYVFSVANNGLRITDEVKEKMFQPFFTTKEVGHGMGLSLGISKSIAEQHGGSLILKESSSFTVFELELPI